MHCLVLFKVGSGRRVFFIQTPLHVNFKHPQNSLSWTKLPPTSVMGRKKNSKQLRVLKTLHPWKELEAKAFPTEVIIFTPLYKNICHGNRKPEASDSQAHDQRDCCVLPWDNVPRCISCSHHLLSCHFFFNLCLLNVLREVTHFKAKVRLSYIIPWTIQNTPPWCTGLPQAWRWRVSPPQPKSSESGGQSQPFLHTGWLLQRLLQKMEPFSNIPLVLGPHSS